MVGVRWAGPLPVSPIQTIRSDDCVASRLLALKVRTTASHHGGGRIQ